MSAAVLAQRIGVETVQLSLAERGRARLRSGELYRASQVLQAPMRLLFDEESAARAQPG